MRKRNVLLAHKFNEKMFKKFPSSFYVQPKLDGIRCVVRFKDGNITLQSSTGRIINTVPTVVQALKTIYQMIPEVDLDGELIHSSGFQAVSSIVNRKTPAFDEYTVKLAIFDVINDEPFYKKIRLLESIPTLFNAFPLRTEIKNKDNFEETYKMYIDVGFEGIILRHPDLVWENKRSPMILKIKPTDSVRCKVISIKEEVSVNGIPKGRCGAIQCAYPNGKTFWVGSGLNDLQRHLAWSFPNELEYVEVRHQGLTKDGIPRFPVVERLIFREGISE